MPVNAINFDAHTDFRIMEGRHSGNGFTYALEEGFLKKYFIFGLHENFVSKSVFNTLKTLEERVKYVTYEEIAVRKIKNYNNEITTAIKFISSTPFGLELDLDALPNVHSSAMTLSGFSIEKARHFIHMVGKEEHASYFHICEGAPDLDLSNNNHLTGKLIATLILDFIKSTQHRAFESQSQWLGCLKVQNHPCIIRRTLLSLKNPKTRIPNPETRWKPHRPNKNPLSVSNFLERSQFECIMVLP
jgi:arginase family enzyme